MSLKSLNSYANKLCLAGYDLLSEEINPAPLNKYGQRLSFLTDIHWDIKCKADPKPIQSKLYGNFPA